MNNEVIEIIEENSESILSLQNETSENSIEVNNEAEGIIVNSDYNFLQNKPKINNVTLTGNVSLSSLGIENYDDTEVKSSIQSLESTKADKTSVPTKISQLQNDSGFITEVPSEYITEDELSAKGYLTSIPSTYKTKSENDLLYQEKGNYALKSEIPDTSTFVTKDSDDLQNYYSKSQTYSKNEIDEKGYITNTNYASSTVAGVIKAQSTYGLEISQSGILLGKVKTNDEYQSGQDKMFISKGTLENVITGKGLINSSYHDNTKQDVINDLDTIRSGASAGATALQSVPSEYAKKSDIPTKTSEFTNDSGFLTSHQDISGKQDKSTLETDVKTFINKTYITSLIDDGDGVNY